MNAFSWCGLLAMVLGMLHANGAEPDRTYRAYQRPVMTWVPPYAVNQCKERLLECTNGAGMHGALTHLGLQFWMPTKDGGLARAGKPEVTNDASILELRDWGRTNGVRVLLCVFNHSGKWSWELAQAGFKEHPDSFIEALLAEVKRLDLDGVDIDLEGSGALNADKDAFVEFIRKLSERLHDSQRHLTVDSFAYVWNAPNQTWWAELLPLVDGLTTMGYEGIGAKDTNWRGYASQKAAAGKHASKLMIGLPTHQDNWREGSLAEHLAWLKEDGEVGVSFWDAQLRSDGWRQPEVWQSLTTISGKP